MEQSVPPKPAYQRESLLVLLLHLCEAVIDIGMETEATIEIHMNAAQTQTRTQAQLTL